jgi:hypothetical protein
MHHIWGIQHPYFLNQSFYTLPEFQPQADILLVNFLQQQQVAVQQAQ